MYVKIHAADELTGDAGKNMKAWNDKPITIKEVSLRNGKPGIEINSDSIDNYYFEVGKASPPKSFLKNDRL